MFSPFVVNQADALYVFNDAAVHAACFNKHPLAAQARSRHEEFRRQSQNRQCSVCAKQITNPDEWIGLGHLVDNPDHPLHRFNYAQFHRSCLGRWSVLPEVIRNLEALEQSGTWKGDVLKWLVKELRKAQNPER
jgi:hypothetical protein